LPDRRQPRQLRLLPHPARLAIRRATPPP
jgi:hypothetical protein